MPAERIAPLKIQPSIVRTELPASAFEMTVIAFLIVVVLYVAQAVLVPLALAVILSFVLSPAVRILRRTGLPNTPSVLLVVAVAFGIIFGVGTLITQQVGSLVQEMPRYQTTLRDKVKSLKEVAQGGSGALKQASDALKDLQDELDKPAAQPTGPGVTISPMQGEMRSGDRNPVPVVVRTPSPTPLDQLQSIIGVIVQPLATAALVVLFVLFLLLQREDVRDRAIRLLGAKDLEKSTTAMDDAGERLGRYFLTLTAINTGYGMFVALGLWMIGVPSPILWGVLAALMRFVPFIGSFIAAVFPLILAAAVDPGWTMFLTTAAFYLVSEPIMGNVIEPVVQGQKTGLSPLAIILSAAFWTLLWGPIGLLMAIPLTVVLVVLGHHVERLEFLNVLLGDTPPLTPPERFYQRMLAGDPAEAVEQAEKFVKSAPLVDYYDKVMIEGLRLAQADTDRGTLDIERLADIRETAEIVVETLADYDLQPKPGKAAAKAAADHEAKASISDVADEDADEEDVDELAQLCARSAIESDWRRENAVLCVASRSALDETAALAFSQLVAKCGIGVKVIDVDRMRHGVLSEEDARGIKLICISALDVRERSAHARFLVRRLKRSAPNALLLGCFWKLDPQDRRDKTIISSIPVDAMAHSMREAVTFTLKAANELADEAGDKPMVDDRVAS
ncbi:AI-2 transport protein TqsA [Hyphomicrobium sp. 1Nfss2.1]|uniref:AI-2E family transporter n=1 Tax=Hyphomicrobium sp. 1Nfss2.1 TaxID=3413936 RepID=UPI003C7CBE33